MDKQNYSTFILFSPKENENLLSVIDTNSDRSSLENNSKLGKVKTGESRPDITNFLYWIEASYPLVYIWLQHRCSPSSKNETKKITIPVAAHQVSLLERYPDQDNDRLKLPAIPLTSRRERRWARSSPWLPPNEIDGWYKAIKFQQEMFGLVNWKFTSPEVDLD